MKRILAGGLALVAVSGAVAIGSAAAAPAAGARSAHATVQVVVRPVTASGHAAHGYTVVPNSRRLRCTATSPVAVDRGIARCGTRADYTFACWKAAKKHHILCLTDPYSHRLYRMRLVGAFGHWKPPRQPHAQAVTLHSGHRYLIRGGGAFARLRQHPSWVGFYLGRSVPNRIYGPPHGDGFQRAHARWTAHVYTSANRNGAIRLVDRAYYVGTAA